MGAKYSFIYDSSEKIHSYLYQHWVNGSNVWVNMDQIIYTYDTFGNNFSVVYQYWDLTSSLWINVRKFSHTFDAAGNMLTELLQLWNTETDTWGNYSYFSNIWDDSQNLLSETEQCWNAGSNSWLNSLKREYQYDYDNEKIIATYYEWYDAWVPADGTININLFGRDLCSDFGVHKIEFYYSTYVSGIKDMAGEGNNVFEIYPNPAGNTVNIKLSSSAPISTSIHVYDACGKLLKEIPTGNFSPGEYIFPMDVSSFEAGFYLVKLNCGGFYETQKLVITK